MSTQYYYHLLCYQERVIIFVILHKIVCLIWYFFDIDITFKFQTNMASIEVQEDVQEETEEKIDTEQGFPHLTAKSGSNEDHMPK